MKRAGLVTTFQTVYSAYLEEKSKFTFSTYKGCQVPFKHSLKKTQENSQDKNQLSLSYATKYILLSEEVAFFNDHKY